MWKKEVFAFPLLVWALSVKGVPSLVVESTSEGFPHNTEEQLRRPASRWTDRLNNCWIVGLHVWRQPLLEESDHSVWATQISPMCHSVCSVSVENADTTSLSRSYGMLQVRAAFQTGQIQEAKGRVRMKLVAPRTINNPNKMENLQGTIPWHFTRKPKVEDWRGGSASKGVATVWSPEWSWDLTWWESTGSYELTSTLMCML